MYPLPARLLWAPRLGLVLGELPAQPRAHLLAGFWGPPRPTRAGDQDYDDISDLVTAWQTGGDLAHCAALASESALRAKFLIVTWKVKAWGNKTKDIVIFYYE